MPEDNSREAKTRDSLWDEVIDHFRQQLIVSEGLAENSVESYCSDLSHFRSFMSSQDLKPSDVDVYVLTDYLESCRQGEYSRRTINRRISTLNRFYSFLKQQQEVEKNPVESLDRPGKNRFFPDYLDEDEVEKLLGAPDVESEVGLRDRALLETLYGAGLRASEAAGLRTDGIDWERGELRIIGKGDKQRLVPLGREALDWLEKYAREARNDWVSAGNDEYFFLNPDGRPVTRQKIWEVVKKYAGQQGLPGVTPHTLRHSFATHMLAGGADLRGLQKMLGHSDVRTTADIYVHLRDEVREAHENFHPRGG